MLEKPWSVYKRASGRLSNNNSPKHPSTTSKPSFDRGWGSLNLVQDGSSSPIASSSFPLLLSSDRPRIWWVLSEPSPAKAWLQTLYHAIFPLSPAMGREPNNQKTQRWKGFLQIPSRQALADQEIWWSSNSSCSWGSNINWGKTIKRGGGKSKANAEGIFQAADKVEENWERRIVTSRGCPQG